MIILKRLLSICVSLLCITLLQAKETPPLVVHGPIDGIDSLLKGPIDITHQSLHLKVDPRVRYISGCVKTTFQSLTDSVNSIVLDIHNELTIDSVISEDGMPMKFSRGDHHITTIQLQEILLYRQYATINIYYKGVPPEGYFGAFVQSAHATDSIIWTLSEPYGARNWWPCRQNLIDKIDSLDLWIKVPPGYKTAGNGLLVSEKETPDNMVEYHWKHRYPIATYLVAFSVTNYRIHEFSIPLQNGPLPIINYLYPEDFESFSATIENILPPMMQLFEKLLIPYPFDREKYGHAQFGFRGGMEHQTMSFMYNFSYELTAHELAHQWFGDFVTCGSWEDVWLNEGFASYFTGLTYEKILKNGQWERFLVNYIKDITNQPNGALLVTDTSNVDRLFNSRLSYKKGAMVLHMLRWILGDEDFFEGIRQYLLDQDTAYAFVRTKNLMKHLELISGQDLNEFFNDWYLGEGYPSFHIQWFNSGQEIHLTVNQTTSDSSVPFFELPLEIKLYGKSRDTLVRLDIVQNDQKWVLPLTWKVDSIKIDPRHWLISAGNTSEVITSSHPDNLTTSLHIFPNPAYGEILFENNSTVPVIRVFLFNTSGQLIARYNPTINPNGSGRISLSNYSPGLYFLKVQMQDKTSKYFKIILE